MSGAVRGPTALAPLLATLAACAGGPPHDHSVYDQAELQHTQLIERLDARIAQAHARHGDSLVVAVSVVDLQTGRRFGIAEDVSLHAASTMKVPVLLELFRQEQAGRLSLDDPIAVDNRFRSIVDDSRYQLDPADDSDSTLYGRIGEEVTLRELARLMIARSSNLATNILIDVVTPRRVQRTMARLNAQGMVVRRGVEDIPAYRAGLNNTTTAWAFARVLETLASCELLSAERCAEVVAILESQEFREKIPAGLPAGTRVANKTGWITRIHHDGAIVYPPGRAPYVIVVLTRGIDAEADANALIADLSRTVWNELVP